MKIVFISHPIAGDVKNNIAKIISLCASIHTVEIFPVAPYLLTLEYLRDEVGEERALGLQSGLEYLRRGHVDELWLFGDKITAGMRQEIMAARETGILIVPKTEGTERGLVNIKFDRSVE